MSERGTELITKARRQLAEMAEFFDTLDDVDLLRIYHDEGAGDGPGDTVGEVAAHMAEGYQFLGRFLHASGYVPGAPTKGISHDYSHGHNHAQAPAAVSDILERLSKAPIGLLADLTDEQFDSMPPAGSSRFSDGHRSLYEVIDAVIAHQEAHLVALIRAIP